MIHSLPNVRGASDWLASSSARAISARGWRIACGGNWLQNERVLLIGTDCLAWSGAALQAAAGALAAGAQMVFTPAEDGGYVLVGARRCGALEAPPPQAFREISWGSAQVLAQTRARLAALGWQPGREWRELSSLWDIDTPQDYLRAQQAGLLAGDLAPE